MTSAAAAQTDSGEPVMAHSGRRRRRAWVAGGIAAAVATAVTVAVIASPAAAPASSDPAVSETQDLATTEVVRGDLRQRERAEGKIGYGVARPLGTTIPGTLTGAPAPGDLLNRGAGLFRIDDRPVLLLLGALPAWREFAVGMSNGADVLQLEQNLAELGYFHREPDQEFGWTTAEAVMEWQKATGLDRTGRLELGRVVFSPAPLRVQSVDARIGDPAGAAILSVTATEKQITSAVEIADKDLAVKGAGVTVSMPDGTTAPGKITAVGSPVEQADADGKNVLMIPLTITLKDPAVMDGIDDATVRVELTHVRREGVLLIPVTAVLAEGSGDFAVEVLAGKKTKRVPVELGAFGDGLVEVTGGGLDEGDKVVVPE